MTGVLSNSRYVVCGMGPAGIGYLFACYRAGYLPEMVNQGLVMIDQTSDPGAGALKDYKITANTTAGTFLECLEGDHAGLFKALEPEQAALISVLEQRQEEPIDLITVGSFLEMIGSKIIAYIEHLGGNWLKNSRLDRIYCRHDNDGYRLEVTNLITGNEFSLSTNNVMLNLGAGQNRDIVEEHLQCQFGKTGTTMTSKLLIADELLKMDISSLKEQLHDIRNVLIIGSSHSSMSVVERIVKANKNLDSPRIGILHRSPIKIFYSSPEEAISDGYKFDTENDICLLSGGVNRFGGLRFAAKNIGLQILRSGAVGPERTPVELHNAYTMPDNELAQLVQQVDYVIPCLGYEPFQIPVYDLQDRPIKLAKDGFGYKVSADGELFDDNGLKLRGLYSFGIGAGQRSSSEIGGEKSFHRRVDGVWLYHFDIGQKVANIVHAAN